MTAPEKNQLAALDKNLAILAASAAAQAQAFEQHVIEDRAAFKEFGQRVGSVEKGLGELKAVLKFLVGIPAMVVAAIHVLKFFGLGY